MKAVVINPKNADEQKFITELMKKLGIKTTVLSSDELEDITLSRLMKGSRKSGRAARTEVMQKLG